jgi:hypothetical protein
MHNWSSKKQNQSVGYPPGIGLQKRDLPLKLQFVSYADIIVVFKDGSISEIGDYDGLMNSGQEFSKLIKTHLSTSEKYEKAEVVSLKFW